MQKKLEAQICVLKQTGNCVVLSNVSLPPVQQDLIQEQNFEIASNHILCGARVTLSLIFEEVCFFWSIFVLLS